MHELSSLILDKISNMKYCKLIKKTESKHEFIYSKIFADLHSKITGYQNIKEDIIFIHFDSTGWLSIEEAINELKKYNYEMRSYTSNLLKEITKIEKRIENFKTENFKTEIISIVRKSEYLLKYNYDENSNEKVKKIGILLNKLNKQEEKIVSEIKEIHLNSSINLTAIHNLILIEKQKKGKLNYD